jgi:TonB family protein
MSNNFRFLLSIIFLLLVLPVSAQLKKKGTNTIEYRDGKTATGKSKNYKKTGKWVTKSANGTLISETEYLDDQKNGTEKEYHANGNLKSISNYEKGIKTGRHIMFDRNGDTLLDCYFRDDIYHGPSTEYTNGFHNRSRSYGNYKNGSRDGLWVKVYTSSSYGYTEIDSTNFSNGRKNGKRTVHKNGKLTLVTNYTNGFENGVSTTYYDDENHGLQSVTNYKNGDREGECLTYYKSGAKLSKEFFTKGIHTACDSVWKENGQPYIVVCYYAIGNPRQTTKWNERGQITPVVYHSKRLYSTDSAFTYYDNGRLQYENRTSGSLTQSFVEYHPNGKKMSEGNYKSLLKSGKWLYYDSTGRKTKEKNYEGGGVYGWYIDYYPSGKIRYKAKCRNGVPVDSVYAYDKSGEKLRNDSKEFLAIQKEIMDNDRELRLIVYDVVEQDGDYGDDVVAIEEAPAEEILTFAEQQPEFPGGQDSLMSYLRRNIKYPQLEKEQDKQGTVYISFVVYKDGTISNVKALKEVSGAPGLTKEAIRVVSAMPKWTPGKMNGRAVNVQQTIPIRFVLTN